jgi:phage terminase Nu1 subunit (DNA packaging protein)
MAHYVRETDDQLRHKSNRTYRRILASLPAEVVRRFGHIDAGAVDPLEERLQSAIIAKDWPLVAGLSARLAGQVR